jgi:diguanylate cyclase (GGDEF)-like protein
MANLRDLWCSDNPADRITGGNFAYADFFRMFCDLELTEEQARDIFYNITDHTEALSQTLRRKIGFRVGMVDYLLNIQPAFACPRVIEFDRYEEILSQCSRDPLTGVLNRRHFEYLSEKELMRSKRYGYPLSVVFFDLDDFKKVNDSFGHAAGDLVLKGMAEKLKNSLRSEDAAARFGGEEFVMLLPQTDLPGAQIIAERILSSVRSSEFADGIRVTFSGGVACFPRHGDTIQELLEYADKGLYEAKIRGKNRITVLQQGKRESKRYKAVIPLTFDVGKGTLHGGTVKNISLSGLAMETDWEPREGDEIVLRFYVEEGEKMYEFRAKIVWTTQLGSADRFNFGVRYCAENDPRIIQAVAPKVFAPRREKTEELG